MISNMPDGCSHKQISSPMEARKMLPLGLLFVWMRFVGESAGISQNRTHSRHIQAFDGDIAWNHC